MATRNRAAILERVLGSYTALGAPEGGWEAIVVDNGSTDHTRDVVRLSVGRIPVKYAHEAQPGKSRAVNAGLREARGDLILFTDDDILPQPGWLMEYDKAARAQPDFDIFGGPEKLKWPFDAPSWALCDHIITGACFAHSDTSLKTGPSAGTFIGGNFAARAAAIAKCGGFDPSIGPAPGSYAMGNEAEFIERLLSAGYKAWWIGDAVVEHIVREDQVDQRWMLSRAQKFGRGEYARAVKFEGAPKLIVGMPRWAARQWVKSSVRTAAAWMFRDGEKAFVSRWYMNYYFGMLAEGRRIRQEQSQRTASNGSRHRAPARNDS